MTGLYAAATGAVPTTAKEIGNGAAKDGPKLSNAETATSEERSFLMGEAFDRTREMPCFDCSRFAD
ncbi:MAG: hypothetical protein NVSMB57_08760 [Actinomycetota bacterium]